MVTIFRNIKETSTPFFKEVDFVLERIRTGKYADLIKSIRSEKNKTQRNELKKGLPAICFSGTFNKRADEALLAHSGIVCLDFDGYEEVSLMAKDKASMSLDKYVLSVFVSPSGNGLKALVRIPKEAGNHKRYFDALNQHFDSKYFDVTSKNISRVCYESYDPDIYINYDSEVWDKMSDPESAPIDRKSALNTIPVTNENKIVDRLMKWWTKKYGLVEGERNHNVFILASAFNEFGVSRSLAEYIMGQMQSSDFPMSEIKITIDSAYRNSAAHGTKFYEDEEELYRIREKINKGASSSEIKKDLRELSLNEEAVKSVVESLEKNLGNTKFWTKTEKGVISLVHYLFKEFLQTQGFYKFAPHDTDRYMFVRVSNNLINKASEEEIKDLVLSYLLKIDDLSIYNFFADKTRFFKDDFLSMLDTVSIHFVEDTKDYSHIYFKNCAIKVTKDKIEPIDYVDLGGYVWNDQVIDRDFSFCDDSECDFKAFISRISGDDDSRINSLRSTIGFLMSGYKDPGFCPSVILNDEVITDNPEGGTGKGLFVQGISAMKNISYMDGKTFSFDKAFAYQTINTDTQIISFDDVRKDFNFERLFSAITEGITIEKKNKDAITIPFRFSPKIVITTNYAIRGKGNSFARRKWELEFKQHYSMAHTPVDEFGKRFFEEWSGNEWCAFDNYMLENLRYYIGVGFVRSDFKNLAIRKLASETCHEFIEWLGLVDGNKSSHLIVYNKRILCDTLLEDFVADNPDFGSRSKTTISRITFYKWLLAFASYKEGVTADTGREQLGKWIIFNTKDDEKRNMEPAIEF
jgi:hypothetical protein